MDYKVQISETGTEYNETIEVATEKQTELFKVPAHNDVDESNILHDFKTVSLFVLASSGVKTLGFIQSSIKPKKSAYSVQTQPTHYKAQSFNHVSSIASPD